MTSLINKIYQSGHISEDFRESIFVPIPKVSKAQECSDFRTIALISHASKVLLHLMMMMMMMMVMDDLPNGRLFATQLDYCATRNLPEGRCFATQLDYCAAYLILSYSVRSEPRTL